VTEPPTKRAKVEERRQMKKSHSNLAHSNLAHSNLAGVGWGGWGEGGVDILYGLHRPGGGRGRVCLRDNGPPLHYYPVQSN